MADGTARAHRADAARRPGGGRLVGGPDVRPRRRRGHPRLRRPAGQPLPVVRRRARPRSWRCMPVLQGSRHRRKPRLGPRLLAARAMVTAMTLPPSAQSATGSALGVLVLVIIAAWALMFAVLF